MARTIAFKVTGDACANVTTTSTRVPAAALRLGTVPTAFAESPEKITGVFCTRLNDAADNFAVIPPTVIPVSASVVASSLTNVPTRAALPSG